MKNAKKEGKMSKNQSQSILSLKTDKLMLGELDNML